MRPNDTRGGASGRADVAVNGETELEHTRRRFQRALKNPGNDPHGPGAQEGPGRAPIGGQQKAASLSPKLLIPASASPDEGVQYQCTECDMVVKGSDPYCPFCGAIFADSVTGSEGAEEPVDGGVQEPDEPPSRPTMVDIWDMVGRRSRSKDLLYQEAARGFAGSARLIEDLEHLVSDVSALGNDTTKARRLVCSAWEACRDGDWNLVSTLARQAEEIMAPSIPDLVRSELSRARENLVEGKAMGVDVSKYLVRMKEAMRALHSGNTDDALRLTKELLDILREDSALWGKDSSAVHEPQFPSSR